MREFTPDQHNTIASIQYADSGLKAVEMASLLIDEVFEEMTLEEKRQLRNRLSEELASEGPQDRPQPKMRIYLNRNNDWTPNKRAAHAVHAALIAVGAHPDCKVIVLDGGPTKIAEMTTVVHDAGHTELEPGTLTAGTNWPEDSED
ncbi:peptidyl tRNA hydrolase [Microbacterium phage Cece]|nr:peptidyl tRNA hydrolase [Microbacterium phage Cece]